MPLIPSLLVMEMQVRDRIASLSGPERVAFNLTVFAIGITASMRTPRIVRR